MYFAKVRRFLMEPSKAFELSKEDTFSETLKFYLELVTIYAGFLLLLFTSTYTLFGINQIMLLFISEILMMVSAYFFIGLLLLISKFSLSLFGFPFIPLGITGIRSNSLTYIFIVISVSVISIIVGVFVIGAVIHAFVYLLGGKKGFIQTIKALMYGSSAALIFGWIPIINIIAIIFSLKNQIIGIRHLQELNTIRAILAILIPSIGVAFLVILLILFTALPR